MSDWAAVYGPPPQLSYEAFVGLWLNLDRQSWRKSWETRNALLLAGQGPTLEACQAICNTNGAAEELFHRLSTSQQHQALIGRVGKAQGSLNRLI